MGRAFQSQKPVLRGKGGANPADIRFDTKEGITGAVTLSRIWSALSKSSFPRQLLFTNGMESTCPAFLGWCTAG